MQRILLIIPAFNEAGIIGRVVEDARKVLGPEQKVLVVDDGSADATAAEARKAGAWVITLVKNLGYGYALQTGYRFALDRGFDVVVQMDGDGQHDAASLPTVLEPVLKGEADVVLGSRALSNVHYPMPWMRKMGQRVFSGVLRAMCGLVIRDPTSGFQAIGPRALKLFTTDDFPGDYPDTDVLLYLTLNGRKVVEAPATFRVNTRGKSMHNGMLKAAYYIYKMLLSMVLVYSRHPRRRNKEPAHGRARPSDQSPPAETEAGGAGAGGARVHVDLSPGPRAQS